RGALLTFIDINERKRRAALSEHMSAYVVRILDALPGALLVLDSDLRVLWANARYYAMFRTGEQETAGNLLPNLGTGQWPLPRIRSVVALPLALGKPFSRLRIDHAAGPDRRRTFFLSGSRILDEPAVPLVLLAIEEERDGREREPS